ncbi:hypothetical protein, variant [Cryptococcus neoformans var. grubii H99]|uniref:Thioesterase domain-containing protein n=1 Tax=Cryptococcus neoformans (strain H99 / ATCC 208821 / CBS 10515 / FGSC 9487) TaxID=235443 RepID=J9VY85_CRYN9|nr:hypothetical protein CNAG_03455 [Cryptococcus neoformans var. grubii H99]XP_012051273.1 hypothetical protein, variant [Cryptococcus neoformans var. grubii H99]AUB26627.1 hypothetical protein CKF44_03455 [Cryptococcus neoformans var. grubii]AFR96680.2 hypothetical protein CNAG_03455 [Cryptococcus neoformans var. grubii H99]AGV14563.1 hypothetical protein, variant [Cryptococcus neoformans var. grubii H99]AUB26628.1 hypothetical protein CKF44_03455 [Cryptococcus neoformans var. grubii]|eukprot:XP_012050959.1 hypothetical protein CNAG_03455 [Cryptococcus neoformans var. grubii H99]
MPLATKADQELFQAITTSAGFAPSLARSIKIIDTDDIPPEDVNGRRKVDGWKMRYKAVVTGDMTNLIGNIHGAAISWLVDTLTSAALVHLHTPTFWGPPMMAGVSLSMEIQYLHPVGLGSELIIDVQVLKCTPTLANLRCEIKTMDSGKIIAVGTHLKTWKPMGVAKL